MSRALQGNKVKVHFTGKTIDGHIFASSIGQQPLEFRLGCNEVLPGIEKAILGMSVGDRKITNVSCDEAYGFRNEELVFDIERNQLPEGIPTDVGQCLEFHYADGTILLLTIIDHYETMVKVDANHPLAGKNLTFEIELIEIG